MQPSSRAALRPVAPADVEITHGRSLARRRADSHLRIRAPFVPQAPSLPTVLPHAPLGDDARCAACGERDARVLRRVDLATDVLVLCANDRERIGLSEFSPASAAEAMLLLLDVLDG